MNMITNGRFLKRQSIIRCTRTILLPKKMTTGGYSVRDKISDGYFIPG